MEHLTADVKGERLFIAGEAAKSRLVGDLRAGKVIHQTRALAPMPKKPIYVADTNEVWSTLTDSSVIAISGTTYEVPKTVKLAGYVDTIREADHVAYDPTTNRLYADVEVSVDIEGSGNHGPANEDSE